MDAAKPAAPLETELKFRVPDHAPIRERLRDLGAVCRGRVLETNHIFDDAGRTLLARHCGLRVRSCRDESGQPVRSTLTFKGAPLPAAAKQRPEIETDVGDEAATRQLLEHLGFVEVIRFEKRRETWLHAGVMIELDELPHLGHYVELEGPDLPQLHYLQTLIVGTTPEPVPETYVALVARHCQRSGADPLAFVFT